jgi:hypothetical protein
MAALPPFLLGPLLYMAILAVGGLLLSPLPTSVGGVVAAGAVGSILAMLAVARSVASPLGPAVAARLGLLGLLGALGLASLGPALAVAPLHAALLLIAAGALGEAFASFISPRLRDASVLVTAAVALALFDGWSVALGPASSAVSGGFLQRLLLEVPAPGGPRPFVGLSDLVMVALLAGLARERGWGTMRAILAGLAGLELALVQAFVTRHAAPALPAIGLAFCAAHWDAVRPDASGWRRTGRWAAGSAVALSLLTLLLRVAHPVA